MRFARSRSARRSVAITATTAALVAGGLTVAAGADAAPPLAPGVKTSDASLRGAKVDTAGRLPAGVPKKGSFSFLLALDAASTASAAKGAKSKGAAASRSAAKSQLTRIRGEQKAVTDDLPEGSRVLYRSHSLLAGVAVRTDVKNFASLQKIDGVTAVYPITPKKPTNAYAVPFQNADKAWQAYGETGAGSTVAIIDTGIDYTHADFGGAGTKAAFDAASAAGQQTNPTVFPTSKVIGGYDLVGDDYNADPTDPETYQPEPKPDANPIDCEGHGSHVAGSAAGVGVDAQGKPYTGKYSTSTPFDSLKIGPGMAPEAKLYAFRVFGCAGSTDVTGLAIERAIDPNGDGDTSDHVDVANLSLGSDFGSPEDADTLLVKKATAAGVTMVISSGNNGDLYDTGGSPGSAASALTVASSQDAQAVVDRLKVGAPTAIAQGYASQRSIAYDWATLPDLKGDVVKLPASNPFGCTALTTAEAQLVKGKIAFVEWNDAKPECPSSTRGGNLATAGATGFIFGSNSESFSAGITGSAVIPGVLAAKSAADAIRPQLAAGTTVTIDGTVVNDFKQSDLALNDTLSSFSSRGVRSENNVKPDVSAVGGTVFSVAVGSGSEGTTLSGTSMAAPMTAGLAGLVKSRHPGWTPEQVKADIMNTANHDLTTEPNGEGRKFAPNRVGSGRIDARQALANNVLAYVTPEAGATQAQKDALTGTVSASFGVIAATADVTRTKTIKVENTGLSQATYDVGYQARTLLPGASFAVSPSTVTVDPRSSKTITVTLTVMAGELTKAVDPSVEKEQAGLPREFVADISGLVVLNPTAAGAPNLRVPVYAAPRPASVMTQPNSVAFSGTGAVRTADLPLTGQRVNQGAGARKVESTVAGFELQATSPAAPDCSATVLTKCVHFPDERAADLKYVGSTSSAPQLRTVGEDPLTSDNGLAYFSVTTQGPWRTPVGFTAVEIYIDSTGDGKADAVTYTTRVLDGADQTDVFVATTVDLETGKTLDVQGLNDRLGDTDTALFDSDTVVLPVTIGALPGVTADKSRISYSVQSYSALSADPFDEAGSIEVTGTGDDTVYSLVDPLSTDVLNPGVAVYGSYNGGTSPLLYADSAGTLLKVRRDATSYAADKGQGALLVHFHNEVGKKAQVVTLADELVASTTAVSLAPGSIAVGGSTTATVTVSGAAATPTGTVTLKSGATVVGTATLANGSAKIVYKPTAVGTQSLTATYAGNDVYLASTSAAAALSVAKAKPVVKLAFAASSVKAGKAIRGTVTVANTAGVAASGPYAIVFVANGGTSVKGTLANGTGTFTYTPKSVGTFRYAAYFAGNANYAAGTSPQVSLKVTK